MLHQRGGFNSSYMTNGWMLRVCDLKVSYNVSNLLTWQFNPNRIRHMIILPVDIHSLWPSEKSTDWLRVFEKGMLRNRFRNFWVQAAGEDIWRFSRTGCCEIYLELFENGLLRRTFRSGREQATDQNIWRYLRTGCWVGHLEVFENRLLSRTFGGI
jgi:hypothetical protein